MRRAIYRCEAGHEQERPRLPPLPPPKCAVGSRGGTMERHRCTRADHTACSHFVIGCGLPTVFVRYVEEEIAMNEQKVTKGRTVLYGIGLDHEGKVVRRPAVVVEDWGTGVHPNLQVYLDGSNDVRYREYAEAEYAAFVKAHPEVNTGERIGDEAVLQRFCDLSNALNYAPTAEECSRGMAWRTSVPEGEGVGGWCWPPRV